MDWTGELKGITQDFETGKFNVTFTINEGVAIVNFLQTLFKTKLSISAKKYSEKRSLDSNSYCWVLCTKIAEVIDSSKEEVYEEMIQRYGYIYEDDNGYVTMTIPANRDISLYEGHWKFIKENDKFKAYLKIKGSSKYNSREMAHFLDMVVLEAKELGIETMTPSQIAEMNAKWGEKNG